MTANAIEVRNSKEKTQSNGEIVVQPKKISGIEAKNDSPNKKANINAGIHLAMKEVPELYQKYSSNGQGHLFKHWDSLSDSEKEDFRRQLSRFEPKMINESFAKANEILHALNNRSIDDKHPHNIPKIEPFPSYKIDSIERNSEKGYDNLNKWNEIGLDLISGGKLAVILLAGGQGTRLGSSLPKGCYDVGLESKKSLLQIQADRISRVKYLSALKQQKQKQNTSVIDPNSIYLPWYIMTSDKTHDQTLEHLKKKNYFGIDRSDIKLFNQDQMPAFDMDGKLLLETKNSLSLSPNGNGGVYDALHKSGLLQQLIDTGIQYVHIYCVDNVLCKVADPVFVGYAHEVDVEVAAKAVKKNDPSEKAGVFCLKDGLSAVAEYSELPFNLAEAELKPGNLLFDAANIANHLLSVKFLRQVLSNSYSLPYHLSHKKITYCDDNGKQIIPTSSNGIKLEKFLFDVFSSSSNFKILMVDRDEEFMALKNYPGSKYDSPEHCKTMLIKQSIRYLNDAGARIVDTNNNLIDENTEISPITYIELSPILSYRGEGLEKLKGKTLCAPAYINDLTDI